MSDFCCRLFEFVCEKALNLSSVTVVETLFVSPSARSLQLGHPLGASGQDDAFVDIQRDAEHREHTGGQWQQENCVLVSVLGISTVTLCPYQNIPLPREQFHPLVGAGRIAISPTWGEGLHSLGLLLIDGQREENDEVQSGNEVGNDFEPLQWHSG